MNAEEEENNKSSEECLHSGHRQRMLERLERNENSLLDHELLEILLFYAIPRKDTNAIAHALIRSFGSLGGVFRASVRELTLVKGVGKATAQYLKAVSNTCARARKTEAETRQFINPHDFNSYIEKRYAGCSSEILEVFCIDKQNRLFFSKEFSIGRADEVTTSPREIASLLALPRTFSVVAAHNHPNATSSPSAEDDTFTKQLCILCIMHNVQISDHVIIGKDGSYSYRTVGRLDKIKADCDKMKLV